MASSGNNRTVPPKQQELEVSIFGPGYGESIVLHLGDNEWGVIDSCLDPGTKRPAALHYLEILGIDVAQCVRFVVATHWHDDHIHGLSSVFKATTSAILACTEAINQPEFLEVISSWTGTRFLAGGSGINEIRGLLSELKQRSPSTQYPSPRLASANKTIWNRAVPTQVEVKALSPADAAVIAAIARIKEVTPRSSRERRRIPNIGPNDASVVLSVRVGDHRVLLGADLETREDRGIGWLAITDGVQAEESKHQVFKLPHHGSPTAHQNEVWDKMLISDPWAATTPFASGNVRLPSKADCQRILQQTPKAYLTAPPDPVRFRDPDRTVEKMINEATRSIHYVPGKYGHVRLRKNIEYGFDSPWQVELFGNAVSMQDYVMNVHTK